MTAVISGSLAARGEEAGRRPVVVRGAGATFPAPLYEAWVKQFRQQHPDVTITYEAVGSGEGQRRFLASAAP